jgi:hypothetical protein
VKNPPYCQSITSIHEFNSISLLLEKLPVENLFLLSSRFTTLSPAVGGKHYCFKTSYGSIPAA